MRSLVPIALSLSAACATVPPPPPEKPPPLIIEYKTFGTAPGKAGEEVLWVLYNGRLARCWMTPDKGPVCMVPPVIKMPAEPFLKQYGVAADVATGPPAPKSAPPPSSSAPGRVPLSLPRPPIGPIVEA